MRILFVCLGNICRSPGAEGVMKAVVDKHGDCDWIIDSAGTGNYHIGDLPDRRIRKAAKKRGYDLTHICRQVRRTDFDRFDYIVGMDSSNIHNLKALAATPEEEAKVVSIGKWLPKDCGYDYVPDPYYEGEEGFELVLDLLESACENIYADLSKER